MKPFLIVVAVLFLNCSLMAESPTTRSSDYESATAWYRAIVTGPQAFADFDFNAWVQYVDTESSATVRDVAITNILLCKENHQRAIPIIQRHFQTESAEWLRKSLVDDLCLCGDQQEARDMLVSIFTNNSELKSVRSESLASLAKLKDPHVLAILYAQLSDPDPQNKIFALQNIPHFDGDWDQSGAKVLDFLNSNLSDNDDVVKETIKCLEDCKYKPAVHDMLRIIEDNRDSHKFWSELTAAADAIQPNVGTDLIKTLKDEDDAIRQARARADAWNAQYASGREQWQRNIEAEKARREQLREDALSKASEQWFKGDPTGFRKEFAADFIAAFIATRQTNFTYDQENVEMGELDNSKGQDTTIGNLKSDIRKYYVSVPIVSSGNDGGTSSQVIFTFKDNSDQTGLRYIQCVQKNGTVETFLHPTGTEEIIASVEKNMGKNYTGFIDPTKSMLPIEQQFPEPGNQNQITVPQRVRHIT